MTKAVYHHCLFGTRYDFLCANYTAFDQTLFNCNFVSNVDCENSKKYWHRNDELYIEKSTTTTTAPAAYNFYTPPPQAAPLTPAPLPLRQPQHPQPAPPPLEQPAPGRRAVAARQRPYGRPRPVYDYYEEDYEEPPRPKGRKKRPLRPRPLYYDDYEEYEDDRLPRRGPAMRRRPYYRERVVRRGKDRRKYDYDDRDYREDFDDDKALKDKRRKHLDDDEYEDDIRDRHERRRPANRRSDKLYPQADKRIYHDDDDDYEEILPRRKLREESRDFDRRRPYTEESKKNPRLGKRRPPSEDFEDDLQRADNSRYNDRPGKGTRDQSKSYVKPPEDGRPIIKPVSGTIYDRPRVAPRINLPVPKNAADKYAYKPLGAKSAPATVVDEEEEEEDEDIKEPPIKGSKHDVRTNPEIEDTRPSNSKFKDAEFRESPLKSSIKPKIEMNKHFSSTTKRTTTSTTTTPASKKSKGLTSVDYEDYYDDDLDGTDEVALKSSPTSTTTTESVVEQPIPIIRKFKRPFLPSRGGNPFSPRNLQPVGSKSKNETQDVTGTKETSLDLTKTDTQEVQEVKPDLRPVPVRVKTPVTPKSTTEAPAELQVTSSKEIENAHDVESESEVKTGPIRIKVPIRLVPPITSQQPQTTEQDRPKGQNGHGYPILESESNEKAKLTKSDILNANIDVSLNEAISPILPKLPVRSFSSFGPTNDYSYKRIQRPTKFVILDPVVSDVSPYYIK